MDENETSLIAEWFRNQVIFVTGSTGFVGKVLVEKLLRDCQDIEKCYILMRTKRGIEPEQRRDDYVNHTIFDRIRAVNPQQLQKIIIISGDISIDGLGICEMDRKRLINETNVIFHCAANVRFDQELASAVNINTLGTQRILELAIEMTQLKVFTHVSTVYCHCNDDIFEERAYAAPHNPLVIATMSKYLDNKLLEYIKPRLLGGFPNTYAYTKALTEDLVNSYSGRIPIVIARPSIVTPAWKEPHPGWIEGIQGLTGLIVAAGRGVLRSMHCNPNFPANFLPVDICTNVIIVAAWERGLAHNSKQVEFRNITLAHHKQSTWRQTINYGFNSFNKTPLSFVLWYPSGFITSNYWHHLFCVIFFHYLPAYLIDGLLMVMRRKPLLVRSQRRISKGLKVINYYTTKKWRFKNDKFLNMRNKLGPKDKESFYIDEEIDWDTYVANWILGVRHFVLKEKPETLPKSRMIFRRLYLLDRFVSLLFYALMLWLVYLYRNSIIPF